MMGQLTVAGVVSRSGVGLHSGETVTARLCPAPPGSGIVFRAGAVSIPARLQHVVDTQLATTLGKDGSQIRTVEHVLAACSGLGVDNLVVEIDGAEVPVLDGCAAEWVQAIKAVGVEHQDRERSWVSVRRPFEFQDGPRWARLEPAEVTTLDVLIDFDHPLIGQQQLVLVLSEGVFERELAWARTFGFARHVPAMRRMGLVRGGSLDNALVFGEDEPLNPGGLRAADEPVRHKMLDVLGDLALLGAPLKGLLRTGRPGHGVIAALLGAALDAGDVLEFHGSMP